LAQKPTRLLARQNADPLDGKISNESPIGEALLGAKVGDEVTAATPGGEAIFKVIKVE